MTRIILTKTIEHLDLRDHAVRAALADAIACVLPGVPIVKGALYRAFLRAVERRFDYWTYSPDQDVDQNKPKTCRFCGLTVR
jgi:hypothetical protein